MNIPVGNYDFKTLVENGSYVDKTAIIEEILERLEGEVIVASRPRRFGKSLMLSMLKTFFDEKEDAGHYFDGLYIHDRPGFAYHNRVPVLSLSFKNVDGSSTEDLYAKIRAIFLDALSSFDDDALGQFLTASERQDVESIRTSFSHAALENALYLLIKLSSCSSGKKCYVFIDEYDLPVFSAFLLGEESEIRDFFKRLYSAALKGNKYLGFALLTGVMNSAKDSLSSGLNNVVLDNGLYTAFSQEYFAFAEEEVLSLAKRCKAEVSLDDLRQWYGGYTLYERPYYNPWSVINFLSNKGMYLVYWASTGSSAMIYRILRENPSFSLRHLLKLINGEGVEMSSDFSIGFRDMNPSLQGALVEFCALGYLSPTYDRSTKKILARIPNAEVLQVFQNEIRDRFLPEAEQSDSLFGIRDALLRGQGEEIARLLKRLFSSLSTKYFSDESRYQVAILVLASVLFEDCLVREEVPSGTGVSDIMILPRRKGGPGAILELKYLKYRSTQERLEKSANEALAQIRKKDYPELLRAYDADPILLYGVSCAAKQVAVAFAKAEEK